MKKIIAVLLMSLSQLTNAQPEKIEISFQHPKIQFFSGLYNFEEFLKLPCNLQLEELLEVNEKYGYTDGAENLVQSGLQQKRYLPESQEKMEEAFKMLEMQRRSFWEERSHKYFLFFRYCHAHKNPDQSETNPAESKKDYDNRMSN